MRALNPNTMNAELVAETERKSIEGTLSFPDVVRHLITAGVESYHVDYAGLRKTFYGAESGTIATSIPDESLPPIAADFDVKALRADILDSQLHHQSYRRFTDRAMAAGTLGYLVFLRGKRVVYFGRQGDQHVEWFPNAQPGAAVT